MLLYFIHVVSVYITNKLKKKKKKKNTAVDIGKLK